MAEIISMPFKIVFDSTIEREYIIDPSVQVAGALELMLSATVGTITVSVGKAINGQSGTITQSINTNLVVSLPTGKTSIFMKATAISDAVVGSLVR